MIIDLLAPDFGGSVAHELPYLSINVATLKRPLRWQRVHSMRGTPSMLQRMFSQLSH